MRTPLFCAYAPFVHEAPGVSELQTYITAARLFLSPEGVFLYLTSTQFCFSQGRVKELKKGDVMTEEKGRDTK